MVKNILKHVSLDIISFYCKITFRAFILHYLFSSLYIHFFVNGAEDKGTVVKMDSKFVTVVKDDGNFQDIHINDTFFIKDILVNKSWNDMTMEERTVELHKVHAYSPRFLGKSWQELPKELKDVMKSNIEQGHLGGGGRSGHAVETSTAFDAEEDYEGESHDTKEEEKERKG